ncbi:hypothetical protein BC940DRAFT_295655 [Gongronella butleri]|nr:hypothetical protein BC940DRAFT_295655 [Gongronella butleri]
MRLSQQLGMSPRTVQIWFQNKRQALKRPTSSRMYTAPQQPIMTLPPLQLVAPPTASYTLSMPSPYCF